jgi:hypothetical protein
MKGARFALGIVATVTAGDWLHERALRRAMLVLMVALVVIRVDSARASRVPAPTISPNWSGYVVTGRPGSRVRFSSATGTWKEPSVSCNAKDHDAFSTIAVGLGGYGRNAQSTEQVGADANCDPSGRPTYFGWFDLAPYPSYTIPHKISPGDVLTATVSIVSTDQPPSVKVQLTNATRGWSFEREISWVSAGQFLVAPGEQNAGGLTSPAASSAEWLVEAPSSCQVLACAQSSLANFRSVAMTGISAVGNGLTGTLTEPTWNVTRLRLVPGRVRVPSYPRATPFARNPIQHGTADSPAGATTGPRSADGKAFHVKWTAVAKGVL